MFYVIKNLLPPHTVSEILKGLDEASAWGDGADTAHGGAKKVKNNKQLAEKSLLTKVQRLVLNHLNADPRVENLAMPVRILPPFVNKHEVGDAYGVHVDRASRVLLPSRTRMRCDMSMTISLSKSEDYEGGGARGV